MTRENNGTGSVVSEHAGILRMAIPLMTSRNIPVTPQNYAIWYHYVAQDKPGLKEHIDTLLEDGTPFNERLSDEIYQQFLAECNLEQTEYIRQMIQSTLRETSANLQSTGNEAAQFGDLLGHFGEVCGSAGSINDVYGLVNEVLEETRQMKDSMDRIKLEFAAKSAEMDEIRKELEEVRKQASTDSLTGLSNRATFFDTLESSAASAQLNSSPMCVVMIDIDHFKRVNDTFGHLVGDKVIRFVADTLKKSIKGQDTPARYGGEEFAILLPGTSLNNAVTLCNNIRELIAGTKLVRTGSKEPLGTITISAGVAQYRAGEDILDLLRSADDALYQSKENGRNQVTAAEK